MGQMSMQPVYIIVHNIVIVNVIIVIILHTLVNKWLF